MGEFASCPAGYETRLEGAGAAECSPCAAGFFATAPNTPFCAKCEPGTFANSTATGLGGTAFGPKLAAAAAAVPGGQRGGGGTLRRPRAAELRP
ncbi:hypothetical protein CHLNCDRAFT_142519 [Chlorella variabilis]|uniref:Tyrosine-protein kinase ephrin type A/B receptor-like domain-containing protein n=1 Tax=Chlorella variabilis TaxID=554065 RepID=E1ZTT9_CHLVA|nr:hypothetical protein CHLNCDRAFT_142519 [Chlorella variabilis]EFN50769.1 hypothetical protein CHLNCDRAFT_142519 [Chlorella variabilis]|eukprot:XP_005842881.1 hypothetical protein CHLNCDRAFT_142519 [Chlorella variabilis]